MKTEASFEERNRDHLKRKLMNYESQLRIPTLRDKKRKQLEKEVAKIMSLLNPSPQKTIEETAPELIGGAILC
jgi:hypothetical protein